MTTLAAERTWMDRANCTDPQEMAVPQSGGKAVKQAAVAHAKTICASCPVITECRHWALTEAEPLIGIVVGGMSPSEYQRARQQPEYRAVWTAKRQGVRCGTLAGYALHSRLGTTPCWDCRDVYRRMSCPEGPRTP